MPKGTSPPSLIRIPRVTVYSLFGENATGAHGAIDPVTIRCIYSHHRHDDVVILPILVLQL
jgi:hypothetical protein